jgi:hypothetical protein
MVVATAQQIGNVFVKAAVPGPGLVNLILTGNAPVGGLKVAYFVLNLTARALRLRGRAVEVERPLPRSGLCR